MPSEAMPQTAKGVLAAVASNVLFAMLFLYSSWMKPMNGTDVFAWRIIEEGSHAELLEKHGLYAKLWAHQSGGFLSEHAEWHQD